MIRTASQQPPCVDYLVVDAMSVAHRVYHSYDPALRAPSGFPTNVLTGFYSTIASVCKTLRPRKVIVAMEGGGVSVRRSIFPAYKANRSPHAPDFERQVRALPRFCAPFGWRSVSIDGAEADDVVAAVAQQAELRRATTVIISADKDLLCLLSPLTRIMPKRNQWATPESVFARFGVQSKRIPELLAIAGDSSDNIPGIPGVGAAGAARLLRMFDSTDDMFHAASAGNIPGALGRLILAGRASYDISRRLVSFIPVSLPPGLLDGVSLPDPSKVIALFDSLGMKAMRTRFEQDYHAAQAFPPPPINYNWRQPASAVATPPASTCNRVLQQPALF